MSSWPLCGWSIDEWALPHITLPSADWEGENRTFAEKLSPSLSTPVLWSPELFHFYITDYSLCEYPNCEVFLELFSSKLSFTHFHLFPSKLSFCFLSMPQNFVISIICVPRTVLPLQLPYQSHQAIYQLCSTSTSDGNRTDTPPRKWKICGQFIHDE